MKVCPNCNNNIDDGSVFCVVCGTNVASPQSEPQPEVTYAPPVQPQGTQPVPPNNTQAPSGQQVPPQGVPYYTAQPNAQANPQPVADQFDHTSEFDAKDIADNKLYALLVYLLGILGIIVALLIKIDSPYLKFHINQGIKLTIIEAVVGVATALFCWTCIVPVVGNIALITLTVVQIICIIDVCSGKAKDAPIVRSIKFLD